MGFVARLSRSEFTLLARSRATCGTTYGFDLLESRPFGFLCVAGQSLGPMRHRVLPGTDDFEGNARYFANYPNQLSKLTSFPAAHPRIIYNCVPEDPDDDAGRVRGGFANGRMLAVFDRFDYWQVGYVFPKGTYKEVRAAGLEALRTSIVTIEPQFVKHVEALTDWQQFSLLSVESSRCPRWYKAGLLLIGDAAHVMSPVGGVGINYAIQDATVASNILASPLKAGRVEVGDLAKVQSDREWPTRIIQAAQSAVQRRIVANVLNSPNGVRIPALLPLLFRIPVIRDIPARLIAFGVRRAHVEN
jgi:2-polyprenyl-6-methoxyphenol hydroxylase-like FAD-dependent oxidoreductase